jgi:hypothetical protein
MISSLVSRASAAILLLGGVTLLFAPDVVLPALVPAFPPAAMWLGQLLAAAWLGVAALNWLQRGALLGGIYGRSVVLANVALYFISELFALSAFAFVPAFMANEPTPWMGISERSAQYATNVWYAALAVTLLRRAPNSPVRA